MAKTLILLSILCVGLSMATEDKLDLGHYSDVTSNTRGMEPSNDTDLTEESQKLSQINSQAHVLAALVHDIEELSAGGNLGGGVKKQSLSSIQASVGALQKAVKTLLETSKTTLETMLEFNDEIAQNALDILSLKKRVSALESGSRSSSSSSSSRRPSTPTRAPSRPRIVSGGRKEPCDGLLYQGRCYYAIFYINSGGMSYSDGEDICREKGGRVGYFHRADHYKDMMRLMVSELKRKSPLLSLDSISSVYIWLGLTINFTTRKVEAEGEWPIHQAWDYDYPSMNAAYTRVVVKVSQFPGDDGGMQNRRATSKAAGVLCQRSM